MADISIRAIAYEKTVRAFAVDIKETLEKAIKIHGLNPIAATALGRSLAAVSMMSGMTKAENETTTLRIKGDGPMMGLVVVGSSGGMLKGYVSNRDVSTYGDCVSLGVGACIGSGTLSIIKDLGMKESYTGTVSLQTGEIGDDLAYYFTYSEQIPSLVALGVKLNSDATVESAAGFIIQLMPGASEDIIGEIETRLREARSATNLMEKVKTPGKMLEFMLPTDDLEIIEVKYPDYRCNCNREEMLCGVISLGREELEKIIKEQDTVETLCHYCLQKYHFKSEEIRKCIGKDEKEEETEEKSKIIHINNKNL